MIYGEKSYLYNHLKFNLIKDNFYFFSTPNKCKNLKDFWRFLTSTILLFEAIKESNLRGVHLFYASSEAVEKEFSLYSFFKRIHEIIIITKSRNYNIIRFCRVYSSDRNSGLIKKIKENKILEKDMEKEVEFIELEKLKKFWSKVQIEISKDKGSFIKNIPNSYKKKLKIKEIKELLYP